VNGCRTAVSFMAKNSYACDTGVSCTNELSSNCFRFLFINVFLIIVICINLLRLYKDDDVHC